MNAVLAGRQLVRGPGDAGADRAVPAGQCIQAAALVAQHGGQVPQRSLWIGRQPARGDADGQREAGVRGEDVPRRCRSGVNPVTADHGALPVGVLHGFDATEETQLEVIAEQRIGTFYRVRDDSDGVRTVEVHRTDMPWGRPPPAGSGWTSDAEMDHILRHMEYG